MTQTHVATVLRDHKIIVKAEHLDAVTAAISAVLGVGPDILSSLKFSLVDTAEALKRQHPEFFEATDKPVQRQPGEFDPAFQAWLASTGCTIDAYKALKPENRLSFFWKFKEALRKDVDPQTPTEAERLAERPLHTLTPEQKMMVGDQARQTADARVQPVAKVRATAETAKLNPEQKSAYAHARTEALKAHAAWGRAKANLSSLSPLMQLESSKNIARLEAIMRRGGIDPSP
jgi:hypothetical protein